MRTSHGAQAKLEFPVTPKKKNAPFEFGKDTEYNLNNVEGCTHSRASARFSLHSCQSYWL